jgi:hypothetical protein
MNIIRIILSFILLFAVLVVAGWGLYKLTVIMFSFDIDPNVLAGLIGAGALLLASVISIILQKNREQRINIQLEHRNKFGPIYEEFIDNVLNRLLLADNLGKEPLSHDELVAIMAEFTKNIIVWGSNDVIKAYKEFRKIGNINDQGDKYKMIEAIEGLILAMRKDVGHSN